MEDLQIYLSDALIGKYSGWYSSTIYYDIKKPLFDLLCIENKKIEDWVHICAEGTKRQALICIEPKERRLIDKIKIKKLFHIRVRADKDGNIQQVVVSSVSPEISSIDDIERVINEMVQECKQLIQEEKDDFSSKLADKGLNLNEFVKLYREFDRLSYTSRWDIFDEIEDHDTN